MDWPFAAGIPGEVRVIYFYAPTFVIPLQIYWVKELEPGSRYHTFFWNPRNGQEHDLGTVTPDGDGKWRIPVQPELKDWVLVMEMITM